MKVSVLVTTFGAADGEVARLAKSLAVQTMPAEDFEVLLLDAGSPTETVASLINLAKAMPDARVLSGPATDAKAAAYNQGLERARGEYVLFLSADDSLFPNALRQACSAADDEQADVVLTGEQGSAASRLLTPKDLFRREFLSRHSISFTDDPRRVLPDELFGVEVALANPQVAQPLPVPTLQGSAGRKLDQAQLWRDDYWESLAALFTMAGSAKEASRADEIAVSLYEALVVPAFSMHFLTIRPEAQEFIFERARTLRSICHLDQLAEQLAPNSQRLAQLLSAGSLSQLLDSLESGTATLAAAGPATLSWRSGLLEIETSLTLHSASGEELAPAGAQANVGQPVLLLTDQSRAVTYPVAADSIDGLRARFIIDPATAAAGAPLPPGAWAVGLSASVDHSTTTLRLASSTPALLSFLDGTLRAAIADESGLRLEIATDRDLPRRLEVVSGRVLESRQIELALPGEHDGRGTCGVDVHRRERNAELTSLAGELQLADGRATLLLPALSGTQRLLIGDLAPTAAGPLRLSIEGDTLQLAAAGRGAIRIKPRGTKLSSAPRQGKPARVVLFSNKDSDNLGEQLIETTASTLLKAALRTLGLQDAVVSSRALSLITEQQVKSPSTAGLTRARKAIAGADAIVFGGSSLISPSNKLLSRRLITLLELAQEAQVPVLISSVGVAPFDDSEISRDLRRALTLPVVRQITTREPVEALAGYLTGSDVPFERAADPSIASRVLYPNEAFASPNPKGKKCIGLVAARAGIAAASGSPWPREAQREFWLETIDGLKSLGYTYRVLTTGHYADEVFLDELVKSRAVPPGRASVTTNSPEEFLDQLSQCSGLIGFRLHASTAAYGLSVPAIGLAWDPKVTSFYETIGHPERALAPGHWTAEEAVGALERAMTEGTAFDPLELADLFGTLITGLAEALQVASPPQLPTIPELLAAAPPIDPAPFEDYRGKVAHKLRRAYTGYRRFAYA